MADLLEQTDMEQLSFDDLEVWKPVVGYEGLYEVSNLGRIKSLPRRSTRGGILKALASPLYGHLSVFLCAGKPRQEYVHRLVAEAFMGSCPEGREVRHLNGDPSDNREVNLVYGTHAENMQDMILHGTSYWSQLTHCKNGHEFTLENTRIAHHPDGSFKQRVCRACVAVESRRRRRKAT